MSKKLIFLGGTVGNNKWRDKLITALRDKQVDVTQLFNPVVADWNEEAQKREEEAKRNASHVVYYLGSPEQDGNPLSAYSMVEATMALYEYDAADSCAEPLVVFDYNGIGGHAVKALRQTEKILRTRFPTQFAFDSLEKLINCLETLL
jgi:hypothetical protein